MSNCTLVSGQYLTRDLEQEKRDMRCWPKRLPPLVSCIRCRLWKLNGYKQSVLLSTRSPFVRLLDHIS